MRQRFKPFRHVTRLVGRIRRSFVRVTSITQINASAIHNETRVIAFASQRAAATIQGLIVWSEAFISDSPLKVSTHKDPLS